MTAISSANYVVKPLAPSASCVSRCSARPAATANSNVACAGTKLAASANCATNCVATGGSGGRPLLFEAADPVCLESRRKPLLERSRFR